MEDAAHLVSDYVREKLMNALHVLATHKEDVRERVGDAFLVCHTLQPEDFPPSLRDDWIWITQQVTRSGPVEGPDGKIWRGSVENTMKRIQRETGRKIASRIWELYWATSRNTRYE